MLFALKFIILSKRKVKIMKRKATSIILGCLCVMLVGVLGASIYAAIQSNLRFSNTISFTPNSQNVFYEVDARAYYENQPNSPLGTGWIDNSRHYSNNPEDHIANMYYVPEFSKENRVLIYSITIMNYTSDANLEVSFTLTNPEITLTGTNTIAVTNEVDNTKSGQVNGNAIAHLTQNGNTYSFTLQKYTEADLVNDTVPTVTFYIKTTCHYFGKSFSLDNNFDFSLTKVNE